MILSTWEMGRIYMKRVAAITIPGLVPWIFMTAMIRTEGSYNSFKVSVCGKKPECPDLWLGAPAMGWGMNDSSVL